MFKSSIYLMLALSAALTAMAAPAAMPAGELIKKDPVSFLCVRFMSSISFADIAADSPMG
jgi:hypothetical protein